MNRLEHLLTIFGEEGSEIAQETAKALRFGIHEQRDLPTSNRDRMQKEFNDLLAMVEMLNKEDQSINLHRDDSMIYAKILKVETYLDYSKECGTLTE